MPQPEHQQPSNASAAATSAETSLSTNAPSKLYRAYTYTKGGAMGFLGYILSPLSFWNDALVNLPLAVGFAYSVTYILRPLTTFSATGFIAWTIVGYWLTNLLGFLMIRFGANQMTSKYPGKPLHDILFSLAYTVGIVILGIIGLQELIIDHVNIFPSWVTV